MNRCISCKHIFAVSLDTCPACNFDSPYLDGFKSFAPNLARNSPGFKQEYFSQLAKLEDRNFWFRARNRLIVWAIKKYCSDVNSFLEVGCGTGYVLKEINIKYPLMKLFGSEIFIEGLAFASARVPQANFMQIDARDIPFENEFDVIGLFDVIEHIKEDQMVLSEVVNALRNGGILILTVPQHRWLWSAVDNYACHERRYSHNELIDKIKGVNLEILRSTSFMSILLPPMLFSRLLKRSIACEAFKPESELKINPILNTIFEILLAIELFFIKVGVNFPVGGSRLVICRKRSS